MSSLANPASFAAPWNQRYQVCHVRVIWSFKEIAGSVFSSVVSRRTFRVLVSMSPIATVILATLAATAVVLRPVVAQSSTSSCLVPKPSYAAPSTAPGWAAAPIATGLFKPRGILFDTEGRVLVVQQNKGIVGLTLNDGGGLCVNVKENKTVVENEDASDRFCP
jgi:glucose/arabinose dehydrogenase